MLSDITIGQFFPGDTFLHRLDPRTKIITLLFFMVAIFAFHTFGIYTALTLFTVALVFSSRVPMGMILRSIKPILWILLFTFVIHVFSTPGESLFQLWRFDATLEGIERGAFISLRLILLIVLASLLTFTTSPLKLTDAMESLLSPLKRFGVPAHELAMMMTIALRFVPTLIEETDRIMKAQESRGADFSEGSVMTRIRAVVPILVPLFLSAFRRADDLALAMEARCYHGGEGRTQMKALCFHRLDVIAFVFTAIFLAVLTISSWHTGEFFFREPLIK